MRGSRVLAAFFVAGLALVLVAISISSASADASSIERDTAPLAPAATITVTSTADSGPGTLRQALSDTVSGDVIGFDAAVFPPGSPQTITLSSALPNITQGNLTIDASNAGVILDGGALGSGDGLHISSDGNTIKGLQILNFPDNGVLIDSGADNNVIGGDNGTPGGECSGECNLISGNDKFGMRIEGDSNTISGNYIGTDANGAGVLGNGRGGVELRNGASGNLIGGDTPAERNLISGNSNSGVSIYGSATANNTVSGNYIGTGASGTAALSTGYFKDGVDIGGGAYGNVIGGENGTPGGACTGECNLISGNSGDGIWLEDAGTANTVSGNYIGTVASGTGALGNGYSGVFVSGSTSNCTIGGDTPGERNLISGNDGGVGIVGASYITVSGNYIGTDVSGTIAISNTGTGIGVSGDNNLIGGENATPGSGCGGACNLISGNTMTGVGVDGDNNTVSGNFVGTDVSGTAAIPNGTDGDGVYIHGGATYNTIGGDTPGERNLISGNGYNGVSVKESSTMSNTITGNYIGTDISGTAVLSNAMNGIQVSNDASCILIGGDTSGERNLISGNNMVGIFIRGSDYNTVSGNHIGTNINGTAAVPNGIVGISIRGGATGNLIGGDTAAQRNIISGNGSGVDINDPGTTSNTISGNYIGTGINGTAAIGNTTSGVYIGNGASNNLIGGANGSPGSICSGDCNLISGNRGGGIFIEGNSTMSNTVSGNYIGTNVSGTVAVSNTTSGIWIADGASVTTVGGDTPGERNVISGSGDDGVTIWNSSDNEVIGNYIGTSADGLSALPNATGGGPGVFAGVRIDGGGDNSQHNLIGSANPGEGNVISGNASWGVLIGSHPGRLSPPCEMCSFNTVAGNLVGLAADGATPLGNHRAGIVTRAGAMTNTIGGPTLAHANTIAYNGGFESPFGDVDPVGVLIQFEKGNTISHNHIYDHDGKGIALMMGGNGLLSPPVITGISGTTVSGGACANCTVEIFSDDDDEGRWFHGSTVADGSGHFVFTATTPFTGTAVTATATDADGSTSEFSLPPSVSSIAPIQGTNDVPNEINIYGLGFVEGLSVTLHTTPTTDLSVSYLSSSHLRATVPVSLTAGSYNLTVTNPDGRSDTLVKAYIVFDALANNDDLYAQSHDLWNNPLTVRQGEQAGLGLVVHRQGGDQTLTDVVVHFYEGDPDAGGTFIYTGTIALIAPRSSESTTQVPWTPASAGDYAIYARIDPGDAVTETVETNNTVSATITVLPQAVDTTPPTVTAFAINGGADATTVPTLTLTVSGEDDAGGSGVGAVRFVEFEFVQAAMLWVPVQSSDWLPYTASYTWTLIDVAGVRYVQTWVADEAGNISLSPAKDQINYTPPSDQIAQGQVRVYRQYAEAGQTLSVTVTPISGDPDLYFWSSTGISVGVSNNYTDTVDTLRIDAAVSGTYQIEVYGYTAAEYTVSITVIGGEADAVPGEADRRAMSKSPRLEPVVPVTDEPPGQMAVPTAPVTGDSFRIYLPLAIRNS